MATSKLRQVQAELIASNERLQRVIVNNPSSVFVLELEPRLAPLGVSKRLLELTGYEADEVGPTWWTDRVHPEDKERVLASQQRLFTEGQLLLEYRFLHRRGQYLFIRDEQRVLRDADGHPKEIVGSWTDLTDVRSAEEEALKARRYFETLTQFSPDVLAVLAPDGVIRYVSPSVYSLLGWRQGEIVGKNAREFLHPDETSAVRKFWAATREQPGAHTGINIRWRHRSGTWRLLECTWNNQLRNPLVGGIIINARDITGRRVPGARRPRLTDHTSPGRMVNATPDAPQKTIKGSSSRELRPNAPSR